jgi:hypothetical protein
VQQWLPVAHLQHGWHGSSGCVVHQQHGVEVCCCSSASISGGGNKVTGSVAQMPARFGWL